jgi:predicted membrane channel-forming protein YqfA (hemolysin III family)
LPQPPPAGDGKVTRELVLATALEMDGARALPTRRLGAALKRDPMVLCTQASSSVAGQTRTRRFFGYHEAFHVYVCVAAACQYAAIARLAG